MHTLRPPTRSTTASPSTDSPVAAHTGWSRHRRRTWPPCRPSRCPTPLPSRFKNWAVCLLVKLLWLLLMGLLVINASSRSMMRVVCFGFWFGICGKVTCSVRTLCTCIRSHFVLNPTSTPTSGLDSLKSFKQSNESVMSLCALSHLLQRDQERKEWNPWAGNVPFQVSVTAAPCASPAAFTG